MTRHTMYSASSMPCHASANYAEASYPCAFSACNTTVSLFVDAIVMASIIICTLITLAVVLCLGISLLVLVQVSLLAVLLIPVFHTPWLRKHA